MRLRLGRQGDRASGRRRQGEVAGKSKRLSEELLGAGFSSVRRYQLGIPVWRALGGLTQMEIEGVNYIHASDRTAVFLDARDPQEFSAGSLNGARNTRIVVFSRDGTQSRLVAEAVVSEAFHNVMFFDGPFATIKAATR